MSLPVACMSIALTFISEDANMNKTFLEQFNHESEVVRKSFQTDDLAMSESVQKAYDSLSSALDLTYQAVALLIWAFNNMGGAVIDSDIIATQIGFSTRSVNLAVDELEKRHYMVPLYEGSDCVDITPETKDLIINHYCFYKLIHS